MKFVLHIQHSGEDSRIMAVEETRLTIGRSWRAGLRLKEDGVAKHHAEIVEDPFGRSWIRDSGSISGTKVNGKTIAHHLLSFGDIIEIGEYDMRVCPLRSQDESPPAVTLSCVFSIRQELTNNNVMHTNAERTGVLQALLNAESGERTILSAGFHRLVVCNAAWGCDPSIQFDVDKFSSRLFREWSAMLGQARLDVSYHAEDLAQLLKDEPVSLICLLNGQWIPIRDLQRLRGLSQDKHRLLMVCAGDRDLISEGEKAMATLRELLATAKRLPPVRFRERRERASDSAMWLIFRPDESDKTEP